eukprot:GGOE01056269.1.p1 GENE.GGOE01056269.1~~GGOE01056269.1.p1  ORF type:complete len:266 (-),score=43.02 GGOE01056269.1:200-997(-)
MSSCVTHLRRQFKALTEKQVAGFSVELINDNLAHWRVWIRGPKDTPYEGGCFRARLEFPPEFPFQPPVMTFESMVWHPNVYPDGRVCISILHPPGEDKYGYETAEERWSPIQSVESVLISVISMISDPNDESPANLDAAIQWRKNPVEYAKKCKALVEQANRELPKGMVLPKDFDEVRPPTRSDLGATSSGVFEEEDLDGDYDEDEDGFAENDDSIDPALKKKYAQQLKQLAEMGLTDTARCIAVLEDCKGEIERAMDVLFGGDD